MFFIKAFVCFTFQAPLPLFLNAEADPTIASSNARAVRIYIATSSLVS
jgi:hypothetical protein